MLSTTFQISRIRADHYMVATSNMDYELAVRAAQTPVTLQGNGRCDTWVMSRRSSSLQAKAPIAGL
jgi:hypothetical protein